ncbi:hypothetical protein C5167_015439 [Papaver somniferum]|uniref:RRM domain-containing protein n=1 Tax=Papaver somniferum TaxID=3469 RepID=A0A4Y7J970_PAPSO|nr:hypothetical protein C5167_015439 [Papaver somniferum]
MFLVFREKRKAEINRVDSDLQFVAEEYSLLESLLTTVTLELKLGATRTQNVPGEKGSKIRELTYVVRRRFKFPENSVELYAEKVNIGSSAINAQTESLRYKLLGGLVAQCNVFQGGEWEVSLTAVGGLRELPGLSIYENVALSCRPIISESIVDCDHHELLRPHGQYSVVLAEDASRYMDYRGERNDVDSIVSGSRQIYLTFPAESTFTKEDVSNYFKSFGQFRHVSAVTDTDITIVYVKFEMPLRREDKHLGVPTTFLKPKSSWHMYTEICDGGGSEVAPFADRMLVVACLAEGAHNQDLVQVHNSQVLQI